MARTASCADCGADVVATSAAPVVRGGAIVLLCDGCHPGAGEADYEDLVLEPAGDDYEDLEVSVDPTPGSGGAIHGTHSASVSGALDSESSAGELDREPEPAVIVSPEGS